MTIGVDFDNTLFPTLETVLELYNERHGTQITFDQVYTYNLYDCFDMSVAEQIINMFCEKTLYEHLRPYAGATHALRSLFEQGHMILILTATDADNLKWKEALIQRYFPFIVKENIIRVHQKKLIKTDVLIDDCLDQLTNSMCERVCFDQLYNHNHVKDVAYGIHRVASWSDVRGVIDKLKEEE